MAIIDRPGQGACHSFSAKLVDVPKVIQHHGDNISNHGYYVLIGVCFVVDGTCILTHRCRAYICFSRLGIIVSTNGYSPKVPSQYMDQ